MKHSRFLLAALIAIPMSFALAQDDEDAYRDARRDLNRQRFDDAIAGFQALRRDHPDSAYIGDSYYWEAFALERNGSLEEAVELIDELLQRYPQTPTADDARALRVQVCSDLASRGDGECAALVSSAVRETDRLDSATRLAAVRALINMNAERALPIAIQVATNRGQPDEVRRQALFVIADKAEEIGNATSAVEVLHSVALDETDAPEVRKQAVFWLSQIPGAQTLDLLTALVGSSVSRDIKERAIFAISQHEDPSVAELLRQYALDETLEPKLRERAIFWLGQEGGSRSFPFLTELYPDVTNPQLREQVLFAVSETGATGSAGWLLERARDESESIDVRKRALFWASETGLSTDELDALYSATEERELREHLIWLIAENGGPGSVDSLLRIAENDPDVQMRTRAVFWLGESEDARATDYLLRLLEQPGGER